MLSIRPATHKDTPSIHLIESDSFGSPWREHLFTEALGTQSTIATVSCDQNDRIVGYIFGRVAADEAEVVNIAVDPGKRRTGIARGLMEDFLQRAFTAGARTAYLEVRRGNEPAQALYRDVGFREISVRKRYYEDTGEDALIMSLQL